MKRKCAVCLLVAMLALSTTSCASAHTFNDDSDISEKEAVYYLVDKGIVNGYDDNTFKPNGYITRGEIAKIISLVHLKDENILDALESDKIFKDTDNHWAEKYINYCHSLNVIHGYDDGCFYPDKNVSNVECCKMILSASEIDKYSGDGWDVRTWEDASHKGIIEGLTLEPTQFASRETVAKMLYNYLTSGGNKLNNVMINLTETISVDPCTEDAQLAKTLPFFTALINESLKETDDNVVIAPASVYSCLGMLNIGSDGNTSQQIETALNGSQNEINIISNKFFKFMNNDEFNGTMNNSLWIDDKFQPKQSYLKDLVKYYNAELYKGEINSNHAKNQINNWVSAKTNGKIDQVISDEITDTAGMIINTMYVKCDWETPFDKSLTYKDDFLLNNGQNIKTDFMHRNDSMLYFDEKEYRGIILPYKSDKISFVAILPQSNVTLEMILKDKENIWKQLTDNAVERRVNLSMPKFDCSSTIKLNDILSKFGITDIFTQNANFSNMMENKNVAFSVNRFIQKVNVTVNEEGSEAAAVTTVDIVGLAPDAEKPIELNLNSPFVYAIVDNQNNIPLFIGVLNNPTIK